MVRERASYSRIRLVAHSLLGVFAGVLAFILAGLVFRFGIQAEVFFGLSFALLAFTVAQAMYETGLSGFAYFFAVTAALGYAVEVLGTNLGFPFGKYYYTDFLGTKELGVPLVVPLVWFVIAYLTFSIAFSPPPLKDANRLRSPASPQKILGLSALAALGSVAWDLMIDPMFTSYGYWVWGPQLLPSPRLAGIPATNFLGWFVVVLLMLTLIAYVFRRCRSPPRAFSILRQNTWDSRVAYGLLLVDGVVANLSLGNFYVVVLGGSTMVLFLVAAHLLGRAPPAK